ncbi:NAD(P)-binding protein [Sistotremastrum suecicum HHB10207 ss-3]|uniref:NAD(P)-binding protein n=1 Tax=Sistotremastrum suecicum HHB10207 ss-3 TaxID=1314776 RepID=A0A166IBX8_9AGAM|nr:NAD(P)-binding protein [Sistotremastrum suecicum HHB10207 ss-3]
MSTILDDKLYDHASRAKGAVVLITGASKGIGKASALEFAKYGAKLVIGDIDVENGERTVAEITGSGGDAVFHRCDVTKWDDQVALFELAISKFGKVNVVVPNAGIGEVGQFGVVTVVNGKPTKPDLRTTEINLIAVMQTVHLTLHYLDKPKDDPAELRSLVLIGSMASFEGIPHAPNYTCAKHGILGFSKGIAPYLQARGIRSGVVCPFFADTDILHVGVKAFLAGIPLVPVPRIAGAIFNAATELDPDTDGAAWTLPDDGPVFRIEKPTLTEGVYKMINQRAERLTKFAESVQYTFSTIAVLVRLLGGKAWTILAVVVIAILWRSL